MGNINISIKKEAYEFLRSLKDRNKSFSEVILEFKKGKNQDIMKFFGALAESGIDWEIRDKKMKEFKDSFNKRLNKN